MRNWTRVTDAFYEPTRADVRVSRIYASVICIVKRRTAIARNRKALRWTFNDSRKQSLSRANAANPPFLPENEQIARPFVLSSDRSSRTWAIIQLAESATTLSRVTGNTLQNRTRDEDIRNTRMSQDGAESRNEQRSCKCMITG
jgi:hypothetical protein